MKKIIFLFTCMLTLAACFGQPGSLDSTFGDFGKVRTDVGYHQDDLFYFKHDVAIQPDGKIVVTVYLYSDFGMIRYKPDGSIDRKFGDQGIVTTNFGGTEDWAMSVAIQQDGKIVLAGFSNKSDYGDFAVARYNDNGTLDSSFGHDGKVATNILLSDFATSVAIQQDGKIILAGDTYVSGDRDFALVRYTPKGKLDTTFGDSGIVITDFRNSVDNGYDLALQGDGKILIAGSSDRKFVLLRYLTNGKLDKTFGKNGKVRSEMGNYDEAPSLAVRASGKILLSGSDGDVYGTTQYLPKGEVDSSFGNNGKVITDFENSSIDVAHAIAIQKNGKFIIAGAIDGSATHRDENWGIVRYHQNGDRDSAFGENGIVITDWGGEDAADAIAIREDGKIVIVGNGKSRLAVARYNNDTQYVANRVDLLNTVSKRGELKLQDIAVSPNPAKDILYIKGYGKLNLCLQDQSGKILFTKIIDGSGEINVSQFAAGVYYLKNNTTGAVQKITVVK